jgi:hypothetical protein
MRACLLVVLMSCSGCYSTGRDFPSDLSWVKVKATRQRDVELLLGKPYAVGNAGGIVTWSYAYYFLQLFKAAQHKELKLYWNDDRTVRQFSFTSSFEEDRNLLRQAAEKKR